MKEEKTSSTKAIIPMSETQTEQTQQTQIPVPAEPKIKFTPLANMLHLNIGWLDNEHFKNCLFRQLGIGDLSEVEGRLDEQTIFDKCQGKDLVSKGCFKTNGVILEVEIYSVELEGQVTVIFIVDGRVYVFRRNETLKRQIVKKRAVDITLVLGILAMLTLLIPINGKIMAFKFFDLILGK